LDDAIQLLQVFSLDQKKHVWLPFQFVDF
jgi:hypothetical protein